MVGCSFAAPSLADPSEVSEGGSEIQALPQGGAASIQKENRKESDIPAGSAFKSSLLLLLVIKENQEKVIAFSTCD